VPGDSVVLTEIPLGLLDGLPEDDQQAIVEAADHPMLLCEYSDGETAELRFADARGYIHFIYVHRKHIRPA